MYQFDLSIEYRVIIGISAMVLLFTGFLISFITSQRKKLQYHKESQLMHEAQRKLLIEQNSLLELRVRERTTELNQQKEALQTSLTNLKATQTQLIQKEKMASLGELTAGIAHEIQNPLNFVNNFAEVSAELVDELKEEVRTGQTDDVLAITDDLCQNLQRITLYGKRASSIVRGMLEHARTGTGEKRPTDLNALAAEYLKLAYHGFRRSEGRPPGPPAKDNDGMTGTVPAERVRFNVTLQTDFAAGLPNAEVVPQEISQVLLNLYNNAFYAVGQRAEGTTGVYEPTVWVSTRQQNGQIEIRVKDNGTGIPESVKAKIFQPFFTTKPTGEGTGLGLSLSYDIVTKGHGGMLAVESADGQGTEFVIQLPAAAGHELA